MFYQIVPWWTSIFYSGLGQSRSILIFLIPSTLLCQHEYSAIPESPRNPEALHPDTHALLCTGVLLQHTHYFIKKLLFILYHPFIPFFKGSTTPYSILWSLLFIVSSFIPDLSFWLHIDPIADSLLLLASHTPEHTPDQQKLFIHTSPSSTSTCASFFLRLQCWKWNQRNRTKQAL